MTQTPPTYDGQPVSPARSNRDLWLVVRRALVMVIRVFDEHFGTDGATKPKNID